MQQLGEKREVLLSMKLHEVRVNNQRKHFDLHDSLWLEELAVAPVSYLPLISLMYVC